MEGGPSAVLGGHWVPSQILTNCAWINSWRSRASSPKDHRLASVMSARNHYHGAEYLMTTSDVAAELTQEHREIDSGHRHFHRCARKRCNRYDATDDCVRSAATAHLSGRGFSVSADPRRGDGHAAAGDGERARHIMAPDGRDRNIAGRARSRSGLAALGVHASCWKRLEQHNGKEEPVVYPRAAVDLSDEVADALAEHLRTARTPDGWVCEAIR